MKPNGKRYDSNKPVLVAHDHPNSRSRGALHPLLASVSTAGKRGTGIQAGRITLHTREIKNFKA